MLWGTEQNLGPALLRSNRRQVGLLNCMKHDDNTCNVWPRWDVLSMCFSHLFGPSQLVECFWTYCIWVWNCVGFLLHTPHKVVKDYLSLLIGLLGVPIFREILAVCRCCWPISSLCRLVTCSDCCFAQVKGIQEKSVVGSNCLAPEQDARTASTSWFASKCLQGAGR